MINILAGATVDLYWNAETKSFEPTGTGPKFSIAQLDFWQAQGVFDDSTAPVDRIKSALVMGLTAIDGDADKARAFIAKPKARLVNPLYTAIIDLASGN